MEPVILIVKWFQFFVFGAVIGFRRLHDGHCSAVAATPRLPGLPNPVAP